MKFRILAACILLLSTSLFAQSSSQNMSPARPGLDVSDYSHLLDYRLPEWGYSNWYINLDGFTDGYSSNYSSNKNSNQFNRVTLTPVYQRYHESEQLISSTFLRLPLMFESRVNMNGDSRGEIETKDITGEARLEADYHRQNYFNGNHYFDFRTTNVWRYDDSQYHRTDNRNTLPTEIDREWYDREYRLNFRFGVGTGKVRDITPMIRALRFRERYRQMTGNAFDQNTVEQLADLFSQRTAYNRTYDREQKYLYADLPAGLREQMAGLSMGEALYLSEVYSEQIGQRMEGAQAAAGAIVNYNQYDNTRPNASHHSKQFEAGAYLTGEYYHNLNTKFQVGGRASLDWMYVIESLTDIGTYGNSNFTFEWVWNVIDRIMLAQTLGVSSTFGWGDPDAFQRVPWIRDDQYYIQGTLDYFIENQFSFYTDYQFSYMERWATNENFTLSPFQGSSTRTSQIHRDWRIEFGVRYYFRRAME